MASLFSKKLEALPGGALTDADYIESRGGCGHSGLLARYAYRVTRAVKESIYGGVENDPVARQYIPQSAELKILPEESSDPIGDGVHSPVKGIIHRYPDRVLFMPAHVCAVYCRYCFRREMVGPKDGGGGGVLSLEDCRAALDYIRQNPKIYEVILSGGDPLVLSPRRLADIVRELSAIKHVQIIRFHTRVPIADPGRVSEALCAALVFGDQPVYMAVHVNHVQEITQSVQMALARLHRAGVHLLSQSVLLRGVNDNADVLEALYRRLLALHVKPYYLHHPDFAPGTSHFRVPIKRGQDIMRVLQGRLSGLAMPTYMLDIPGGHGKIPLTPCYIEALEGGGYMAQDYQGGFHSYPPEKWQGAQRNGRD